MTELHVCMEFMSGFCLQDQHLNSVKAELSALQATHSQSEKELDEMRHQIQQLKDQNSLLKAHKGE